jgi:hypothetical protein
VWDIHTYGDFLSENKGRHHVVGSALILLAATALMLVLLA